MNELIKATWETIYMTVASLIIAYALGLPLAFLTSETSKKGMIPNRVIHAICEVIIGIGRSIPFTIFMVLVLPLTRLLIGTGIGTTAVIVPLSLSAVPFIARMIESSLNQVDKWIIKASEVDGASKLKIFFKIKLGSRLYDIVDGIGITSISIIGYTAMAGTLGGGGLGEYAITNGFYRYDWICVLYSTLIIVALVCIFQWVFKFISRKLDYRGK